MDNHIKGLQYENFVKDIIINDLSQNAYLWNQCPENLLIKYRLIKSRNTARLLRKQLKEGDLHNHKDVGIDIVQIDNEENATIVQCKNGYSKGLKIDDLAGIMCRSAFLGDTKYNTSIYYTSKLSANLKNQCDLSDRVVRFDYKKDKQQIHNITNDNKIYFIKLPYEDVVVKEECVKQSITPYLYQIEAEKCFKEHFIENKRGILWMPCGTGKTLTCYLITKKYKQIILLSPLREFAKQNMDRFIEYGYPSSNALLVDTDGDRNIDNITEFINTNETLLISSTYKSMDVLCECLELFNKNDTLFVVDEFHNLSKANISDENNPIYKLLISDHKVLFVSATPRIYDIEEEDYYNDNDMLIGNIVYEMTFKDAIENKYIADYKIWVPFVKENTTDLDKELTIYDIEIDVKNRCKFLFSALANNGSRKCIVYCKDTNDMKENIDAMIKMNEFYALDIDINRISCEDSEKTRKKLLRDFSENNDNIQLLYSIKILNECIDIPSCDSIYISYAAKNKITTIQRMCRALRKDQNNPFKIANIYLWCNEYDEILNTLSAIKEYDCEIIDKIKLNVVDLYETEKREKEVREFEEDIKELKDYIVGIKEFKFVDWEDKLEMVKAYIIENGKLPLNNSKDPKIKQMAAWISCQKTNYAKSECIMKKPSIRQKWKDFKNTYPLLILSNIELWMNKLDDVEAYIENTKKLPSNNSKDPKIKQLARWISTQQKIYGKLKDIMKNPSIRKEWDNFKDKYPLLFLSNGEVWMNNLADVKVYVVKNNKLPSEHSKDTKIKQMGSWTTNQGQNYAKLKTIMKEPSIRKEWEDFKHKNPLLFLSNGEVWMNNLADVEAYIIENNKLPSGHSKDTKIKQLGSWISRQKTNYSKSKKLMKNPSIRKEWEDFKHKYPLLFKIS
jgi:superfamily II DNA or RNA helicase